MGLNITQVDAFTNIPFAGNPAAVCILSAPADDQWMQSVAQEMNLSETAFLLKEKDGYGLRWFTPSTEVDLCGHATLASAHLLWEDGHLSPTETAQFYTRSGLLTAKRDGDWIELNFPANPSVSINLPPNLDTALNAEIKSVSQNSLGYLVELNSETTVRELSPNFALLKTFPVHGVIVTSVSQSDYQFVSRFFAPSIGINEDPVTGSAHCCLGPYWRDRLDRDEFLAFQASPRGGVVKVTCVGDRVLLGGQAITVMRGELVS